MKKNKTIRIGYQLFLLSFVIGHLSLTFCTDTGSSNDLVTFSGSVTLEGVQDMSGVTVSLYAPVELDTALTRINEQYPNIGVRISQETEFDHREQTPLATTTTDANGKWKIEGPKGSYNIVFEKEGYGWKYILEESSTNVADIDLYKEQVVPAVVGTDFVFENGRVYRIKEDVSFLANVTIEKALVISERNTGVVFLGKVSTNIPSGMAWFTGSNIEDGWKGLQLESTANNLESLKINYANDGVKIKSTGNVLNSLIISNSFKTGISIFSTMNNNTIKNIVIKKQQTGISVSNLDNSTRVENIIVYQSSTVGIDLNSAAIDLFSSLIYDSYIGVRSYYQSDAYIKNCEFRKNTQYGIEVGGSSPKIEYSNFLGASTTAIRVTLRGYSRESQPVVHYNNFRDADLNIFLRGTRATPNSRDISAENNWWGTNDNVKIEELIFDKSDISTTDDSYYAYTGYVLWQPYLQSNVSSAGLVK